MILLNVISHIINETEPGRKEGAFLEEVVVN